MFLVMKRFPLDDVPLCLVKTKCEALVCVKKDQVKTAYATCSQEDIADCDIGCPACAHMIVEFDSEGFPTKSKIFSLEELENEKNACD